jgi:hypothetical protein
MSSFWSKLASLFHKVSPHTFAVSLATAKIGIDGVAAAHAAGGSLAWPWVKDFDVAASNGITAINNWQSGPAPAEVTQALEDVKTILGGVSGLSAKDQVYIQIAVSTAEEALAFIG